MDKKDIKKCNKNLTILQIAATDKENLTAKIGKKKYDTTKCLNKSIGLKRLKKNISNNEMLGKEDNTNIKISGSTFCDEILAPDLVKDNPSENYWKSLAETRSKALESALKENFNLHNKINELEYENERLKAMLEETKALVNVLTEMIEQNDDTASDNDSDLNNDQTINHDNENSICSEHKESVSALSSECDSKKISSNPPLKEL